MFVNFSIGCSLFIIEKVGQQAKSQQKNYLEQLFHFGLKISFSVALKGIYQKNFFAV